jgi:hypothetical protein
VANPYKEFDGVLRKHMIRLPEAVSKAPGIRIFGRMIRSIVFSTDVAIIRNTNADAVIAVYPFTPLPVITAAVMTAADKPVFCGVGGGITRGDRVIDLALDAEFRGAIGVVVNAPTSNDVISRLSEKIDIPVLVTIVREDEDFGARLNAGASILNVSGAAKTYDIVKKIKDKYPDTPVIATGGPNDETIQMTIEAGADAITYTPPTSAEIFKRIMNSYRNME